MATTPLPLVPKTIEPAMQFITLVALGVDPADPNAFKKVRVGWQTQGQPAWDIKEDVVFIRCVEEDDAYNRIRDEEVFDDEEDATKVDLLTQYTRVWRTFWTVYGPNSFDRARVIRSSLFTQKIHDLLLTGQSYGVQPYGTGGYGGGGAPLYLVTDVAAPRRVPELYDGQWWERVDFDCQFNEDTRELELVNAVASVEVDIEKVKVVPCP